MNGFGASEPLRKAPFMQLMCLGRSHTGGCAALQDGWDFFTTKDLLWAKGQTKLYFGGI